MQHELAHLKGVKYCSFKKSTATLEKNLETLANVLVDDLRTYKETILQVICKWYDPGIVIAYQCIFKQCYYPS